MFRTALCLALHFASGSPALPAAARDAEQLVIDVDAGAPATPLTFEYGADGPSGARCDTGVDLSQELASMGSSLVRTHDSGVLDWTAVYPHPLAPLDARYPTDDPASYRAAWKKLGQSGSRGAAGVPHGSSEWGSRGGAAGCHVDRPSGGVAAAPRGATWIVRVGGWAAMASP